VIVPADKATWRRRLLAARRTMPPSQLVSAATTLRAHLLPRLTGMRRVAAYVPTGAEPGSLDLLDDLLAGGTAILLPVVQGVADLDWALYRGRPELTAGARGTTQPAGPSLGRDAIAGADIVLVPALAVDHQGVRLGRGAGYYDRALAGVPLGVPVVALLHDGELVPRLPGDTWDRPVTAISSPGQEWTELPLVAHHVG
jgi:5-formyltetrahydrofolate cyclo-ligase